MNLYQVSGSDQLRKSQPNLHKIGQSISSNWRVSEEIQTKIENEWIKQFFTTVKCDEQKDFRMCILSI